MLAAARALQERRALRPEDDEAAGPSAELCSALAQHLCRGPTARAWQLLDELCRFAGSHASGPLVAALPLAGGYLEALEAASEAAESCCQCVETMVNCLGRELLPKLKAIVRPLLKLAEAPLGADLEPRFFRGSGRATDSKPVYW